MKILFYTFGLFLYAKYYIIFIPNFIVRFTLPWATFVTRVPIDKISRLFKHFFNSLRKKKSITMSVLPVNATVYSRLRLDFLLTKFSIENLLILMTRGDTTKALVHY